MNCLVCYGIDIDSSLVLDTISLRSMPKWLKNMQVMSPTLFHETTHFMLFTEKM